MDIKKINKCYKMWLGGNTLRVATKSCGLSYYSAVMYFNRHKDTFPSPYTLAKDKIIDLYNNGESIQSISDTLNMSCTFVHKTLRGNKTKMRKTNSKTSQEMINKIFELHSKGFVVKDISSFLRIPKSRIYYHIKNKKNG